MPRPANLTEDWNEAVDQRAAEVDLWTAETGWSPMRAEHYMDGGWVCGYTPVAASVEAMFDVSLANGEQAMFDQPDGTLIGFAYGPLGFVPAEVAQSPEFDSADELYDRFGCDVFIAGRCDNPDQHVQQAQESN